MPAQNRNTKDLDTPKPEAGATADTTRDLPRGESSATRASAPRTSAPRTSAPRTSAPRGRLLVVDRDDATRGEVSEGRGQDGRAFRLPMSADWIADERQSEVVAELGTRLGDRAGVLANLTEEAKSKIDELLEDVVDAPRARLQREVRGLAEVLGWVEATLADMRELANCAEAGMDSGLPILPLCGRDWPLWQRISKVKSLQS